MRPQFFGGPGLGPCLPWPKTGPERRNSERDRTFTGVEWETWNTFDPTIKNVLRVIKFSFENKIYNYCIFKGSLYSLVDEMRERIYLSTVKNEKYNNIFHLALFYNILKLISFKNYLNCYRKILNKITQILLQKETYT